MGLAAAQNERRRITSACFPALRCSAGTLAGFAQSIYEGMNFGAQSAAGSPNGLIITGFFFAPALC